LEKEWGDVYTNFLDSHFNIECLDDWKPGIDRMILLNTLREEILAMEK